ncbi:Dabb family protein [Roseibium polysiphoniae]|uniref:Dabb family protein n=1 Tax=Roseibium polysiphoniae TaxID=2571221 RepID=A0ABR9C8T1_9HYPH|nr:Dabb family protein [Roseibium polysiphoniae]MBD8876212.1 Dabb family protein [Roseibium polysiphoniae]
MILHCVFCNFRADSPPAERSKVFQELQDFSVTLDGVLGFEFGPNLDFERKSQAYDEGFVIRFKDVSALEAYANHPVHRALGGRLCDLCEGGADGIVVFDLDVPG